ncbi:hypothetical protein [Niallia circulans]|uniref:hypothetical protein n=1 Tax=Niallia circulans TaxID=1397 RepID=UPI0026F32BD1|nr:hypothetical protein [Niallia circulans]
MAFRSRKLKDAYGSFITEPKRCSNCGEMKAFHSVHGGLIRGSGKKACQKCITMMRKEEEVLQEKEESYYQTEGERQAMRNYGI